MDRVKVLFTDLLYHQLVYIQYGLEMFKDAIYTPLFPMGFCPPLEKCANRTNRGCFRGNCDYIM